MKAYLSTYSIIQLLLLSVLNFSCANNVVVELTPKVVINSSIFHSDTQLGVLGDAYKQYHNTNPKSDEIVSFVADFAASKAYVKSFLVTKQANEHIIWSLGEIVEADRTSILIAPIINSTDKKFTKTVFISKRNESDGLRFSAAIEQDKNESKDINNAFFLTRAFHLSLGKDDHTDRHLILTVPVDLEEASDENKSLNLIQLQIAIVGDTWDKDYTAYLNRDFSAPSYIGKTVRSVYGNYVYRYDNDNILASVKIPLKERMAIFNTD